MRVPIFEGLSKIRTFRLRITSQQSGNASHDNEHLAIVRVKIKDASDNYLSTSNATASSYLTGSMYGGSGHPSNALNNDIDWGTDYQFFSSSHMHTTELDPDGSETTIIPNNEESTR